tara:strand:- start:699 stop:1262 length:564 start_codon:yes stop_codon:yes gene_type:complete
MNTRYLKQLQNQIQCLDLNQVNLLSKILKKKNQQRKNVFICGNGGSAANSDHITNDLMFGFTKKKIGFSFISLCANSANLTCLANDIGYENIFSNQLKIQGKKNDLLIVLSGSGNSKNILKAIKIAKIKKIETFGLIGFNGGKAIKLLDNYIHFRINDMQVSEDMQMITMNLVMKNILSDKFKFYNI